MHVYLCTILDAYTNRRGLVRLRQRLAQMITRLNHQTGHPVMLSHLNRSGQHNMLRLACYLTLTARLTPDQLASLNVADWTGTTTVSEIPTPHLVDAAAHARVLAALGFDTDDPAEMNPELN